MFKNCTALRIISKDTLAMFRSDEFEEIARNNLTEAPHKTQWRSYGFHIPEQFNENPIYTGALGVKVFYICKQERVLPGAVINDKLGKRIVDFNEKNERPPHRKEIAEMKDDLIAKLLPGSHVKPSYTMCMVTKDWLLMDTGSSKIVEDNLTFLRDVLSEAEELDGTPEWQHVNVTLMPTLDAPAWLRKIAVTPYTTYAEGDEIPEDAPLFRHLDSVVLKSKSKGGVARFKDMDFSEVEVDAALESNKSIVELALEWGDDPGRTALSCVITNNLVIRRLKFAELNLQEITEEDRHNAAAIQFDATVALVSDIMVKFVNQIYAANRDADDEPVTSEGALDRFEGALDALQNSLAKAGGRIVTGSIDQDGEEPKDYGGTDDPLYFDAVIHVQSTGSASISKLQRHLRVGYNRAVTLIETMEENSIVSATDATGARTVFEDDEI